MRYLMVVPVQFYRPRTGCIAIEDAFAEHLRMLRQELGEWCEDFAVAAPVMPVKMYEERRETFGIVDEQADGIRFIDMHREPSGRIRYNLLQLIPNAVRLFFAVRHADIVHAAPSFPLRLFNFLGIINAVLQRKASICVVDIDNRLSGSMLYSAGLWTHRAYVLNRFVYAPLRRWQIRFAVRHCSLVLLKGEALVSDYGCGAPHVKGILDVVHDIEGVITDDAVERRIRRLREPSRSLRLVYFGRLVAYKGVDHSLRVVRACRDSGLDVAFRVIGHGDQLPRLRQMTQDLDLQDSVEFVGAVPYARLAKMLEDCDLLLATPLSEDTPRNAIDAMANGIPIVAYGTYYYQDLKGSGAVVTASWNDVDGIADRVIESHHNRGALANRVRRGVRFARENTQEVWLRRRVEWTHQLCCTA